MIARFRDKNVVIARFRDKNVVIACFRDKNVVIARFRDKNAVIARFRDKTMYVWMGILPLKKRVNLDKCSFATKQRMFGVFAIEEPGSPVPALYATLISAS